MMLARSVDFDVDDARDERVNASMDHADEV